MPAARQLQGPMSCTPIELAASDVCQLLSVLPAGATCLRLQVLAVCHAHVPQPTAAPQSSWQLYQAAVAVMPLVLRSVQVLVPGRCCCCRTLVQLRPCCWHFLQCSAYSTCYDGPMVAFLAAQILRLARAPTAGTKILLGCLATAGAILFIMYARNMRHSRSMLANTCCIMVCRNQYPFQLLALLTVIASTVNRLISGVLSYRIAVTAWVDERPSEQEDWPTTFATPQISGEHGCKPLLPMS